MVKYQDLVEGMEVEVTGGMYKGRTGVITNMNCSDPKTKMPEVMVFLGERNRESNQNIVHPFGYGLNKLEYLKIVGR
ncbi:MAG: hypothetical protein DYH13_09160 [Alphaproteobacteria bacterium PRO2]|nr:hypothetical protein [Alphaproteobacteria bacterium PRO2]